MVEEHSTLDLSHKPFDSPCFVLKSEVIQTELSLVDEEIQRDEALGNPQTGKRG